MRKSDTVGSLDTAGKPLKGVGDGKVRGKVVKWDGSISFLGDVDPVKGTLTKKDSRWDIKDRVLVFREGSGSTVGSYVVYNLRIHGNAPAAIVMVRADAIITIGCILADIPLINGLDPSLIDEISTGDILEIDPGSGSVRSVKQGS